MSFCLQKKMVILVSQLTHSQIGLLRVLLFDSASCLNMFLCKYVISLGLLTYLS